MMTKVSKQEEAGPRERMGKKNAYRVLGAKFEGIIHLED
jgi:hypothetical protein